MSVDGQTTKVLGLGETSNPGASWAGPSSAALKMEERYQVRAIIGAGGMGVVERVYDGVLEREVVRKVIHRHLWPLDDRRFVAEARITGRLQHPGVIPVLDLGTLPDGRPYYTMEEVQGRNFSEVIDEIDESPEGVLRFRRALDAFRRVCETVAYAHALGVVHCDLKPANVMVGVYGEVRILDWGLALEWDGTPPRGEDEHATSAFARDALTHGSHGADVVGTPAYMPPEQARGEPSSLGPWSDVYALGATLYQLLAGVAPYQGTSISIIRDVGDGPPRSVLEAARAQGRRPPPELCELVSRSMTRDPRRRPRAAELAAQVMAWLDGARRREMAHAQVDLADELVPAIVDRRQAADELRARADELLAEIPSWAPEEQRHEAWELLDEATGLEQAALQDELSMDHLLHAALQLAPELEAAHTRLADLYQREHAESEARRDLASAARFEALLREHDRGAHATWLRGDGTLTLLTEPPGASATLYRFEEHHRRLEPALERELGPTPILDLQLPRGSYLVALRLPGHAPVRYPVFLERGARWDGVPPGGSASALVWLPPLGQLGERDVYVPAGWFWSGGDGDAVDGLPRTRRWVDTLVVRRFPVTNAEYLEFLNDLLARGDEAAALGAAPLLSAAEGGEMSSVYDRSPDGRFVLRHPPVEHTGGPDSPVTRVTWWAADAYASWEARRSGRPWRMLHDHEWEKAARGVDGRCFPWGDAFDASRAQMIATRQTQPTVASVHSHPFDESPYGVRGLAGNVRDWCANGYERRGPGGPRVTLEDPRGSPWRMVRGGAWASTERFCRLASRFADPPDRRVAAVGFRIGYSYDGSGSFQYQP